MAKKRAAPPAKTLGALILEGFVQRRDSGGAYPCAARDIASEVRPDAAPADVQAALLKAPLKTQLVPLFAGDADVPAVLKEDVELLARDDRTLRALLDKLCAPERPLVSLTTLKAELPTALRKPFETAWSERIAAGRLPAGVAFIAEGKPRAKPKGQLHDTRFALPWIAASQRLTATLHAARHAHGDGYPVGLARLAQLAQLEADPQLLALARNSEPFASAAVSVFPKDADRLLFAAEDAPRIAAAPVVLRETLRQLVTADSRGIDVAKLEKAAALHPALRSPLAAAARAQIDSQTLPAELGALRIAKKWHLFELADVRTGGSVSRPSAMPAAPPSSSPAPRPGDFAAEFTAAFDRLDRESGGRNFLKLHALRQALPAYGRADFDAGLRELRRQRRFSLESSDGNRVTLTDEERDAGVMEAGSRLIYCSRVE